MYFPCFEAKLGEPLKATMPRLFSTLLAVLWFWYVSVALVELQSCAWQFSGQLRKNSVAIARTYTSSQIYYHKLALGLHLK